jgi:phage shock protein E
MHLRFLFLCGLSGLFFACQSPGTDTVTTSKAPAVDSTIVSLDSYDFYELTKKNPNLPIIDFRTPAEFKAGHLQHSVNFAWTDTLTERRLASFGREQPFAVYCLNGALSREMAEKMKQMGFKRIYHLQNGLMTWGVTGQALMGGDL